QMNSQPVIRMQVAADWACESGRPCFGRSLVMENDAKRFYVGTARGIFWNSCRRLGRNAEVENWFPENRRKCAEGATGSKGAWSSENSGYWARFVAKRRWAPTSPKTGALAFI